jgi:hypothetical protein
VQVHANGRDYTAAELRAGALGPGIVCASPQFVAPAWGTCGNYHVAEGSPLIDAGTSTNGPPRDLEGLPRPAGAAYDIGAYEHGAAVRAPHLRSIAPAAAPPGAIVAVRGTGFGDVRGAAAAWFGPRRAAAYPLWSSHFAKARVPAGASGRVLVCVRTPGGRSERLTFRVLPVISRISPSQGHSGTLVTIRGRGFGQRRSTACVSFGGIRASRYASWSQTRIAVRIPAQATGTVTVTVHTAGGTSNACRLTVP